MENYSLISKAISKQSAKTRVGNLNPAIAFPLTVITGVAFLAALSQISIPFPGSPVPITGQTLGVLLIGSSFGVSSAAATFLTYLVAGIAGLPFFAGGASGWQKIAGPTGGYLVGMLFASILLSYLSKNNFGKKIISSLISFLIAESLIFTFGVLWLQHYTHQSLAWSLANGFTPFILGEFIKIGLSSSTISYLWRKR